MSNTWVCSKGHTVAEPSPQSGRSWCRECDEYTVAQIVEETECQQSSPS